MKKISKKKFNIYMGYNPNANLTKILVEERYWCENDARTLFGVIVYFNEDKDYSALLFGRDKNQKIRPKDTEYGFTNITEAKEWLHNIAKKREESGDIFSINDENDKEGIIGLFTPIVDEQYIHFNILNTYSGCVAAKELISEIAPHFCDVDGNFIEQFQTNGFDARLFELFLFCYFNEENLNIDRTHNVPDFLLSNGKIDIGLEATIVGRKTPPTYHNGINLPDIEEERKNNMPIKYGSPLYSKLIHKTNGYNYWEHPHTLGKPFVIAIADFHDEFAMAWSKPALEYYLYGYKHNFYYDDNKNLIIIPEKINEYEKANGTKIPPGFFFQHNTENISAILHTTSATLSTFNRIGKQCGFGKNYNNIIIREGYIYNHDKNASKPNKFSYEVTEECNEKWGDSIAIYHNPNALYPLDKDFFKSVAQHTFEDGNIISQMPEIHVYSSISRNTTFI